MTEIRVTRDDLRAYVEASGDDNPIHLDDGAARVLGLPGVIAHGMWTMGAALATLDAPVVDVRCRFRSPLPVPPDGTSIVVTRADEGDRTRLTVASGDTEIARIDATIAAARRG